MTGNGKMMLQTRITHGGVVAEIIEEWTQSIELFLSGFNIQVEIGHKVGLAVDEILTNLVAHASSRDSSGVIAVECIVEISPEMISVLFRDDSAPFNPGSQPEPALDDDPMKRRIGGLGLAMLFSLFDSMEYNYSNGRNESRWLLRL